MPPLMPDEEKNFGGSLVLDFRKKLCEMIYCSWARMHDGSGNSVAQDG